MSVTPRDRARNRGHVMDADVKRAERAEAKRNAPKLRPLVIGQQVTFNSGYGNVWVRVSAVLDADRAQIVLTGGGRLIVPRSMLNEGS